MKRDLFGVYALLHCTWRNRIYVFPFTRRVMSCIYRSVRKLTGLICGIKSRALYLLSLLLKAIWGEWQSLCYERSIHESSAAKYYLLVGHLSLWVAPQVGHAVLGSNPRIPPQTNWRRHHRCVHCLMERWMILLSEKRRSRYRCIGVPVFLGSSAEFQYSIPWV